MRGNNSYIACKRALLKIAQSRLFAKFVERLIENICNVSAFFIAAKLTGNFNTFIRILEKNAEPFIRTIAVSFIVYPFLQLFCDMASGIVQGMISPKPTELSQDADISNIRSKLRGD